jgi:hypothetical protein
MGPLRPSTYPKVLSALEKNQGQSPTACEIYIRDCFDWFFYFMDRIEHYILRSLIDFDDVKAVFKTYAHKIARDRETYNGFLRFHEYELAGKFLDRYDNPSAWEKFPSTKPTDAR